MAVPRQADWSGSSDARGSALWGKGGRTARALAALVAIAAVLVVPATGPPATATGTGTGTGTRYPRTGTGTGTPTNSGTGTGRARERERARQQGRVHAEDAAYARLGESDPDVPRHRAGRPDHAQLRRGRLRQGTQGPAQAFVQVARRRRGDDLRRRPREARGLAAHPRDHTRRPRRHDIRLAGLAGLDGIDRHRAALGHARRRELGAGDRGGRQRRRPDEDRRLRLAARRERQPVEPRAERDR